MSMSQAADSSKLRHRARDRAVRRAARETVDEDAENKGLEALARTKRASDATSTSKAHSSQRPLRISRACLNCRDASSTSEAASRVDITSFAAKDRGKPHTSTAGELSRPSTDPASSSLHPLPSPKAPVKSAKQGSKPQRRVLAELSWAEVQLRSAPLASPGTASNVNAGDFSIPPDAVTTARDLSRASSEQTSPPPSPSLAVGAANLAELSAQASNSTHAGKRDPQDTSIALRQQPEAPPQRRSQRIASRAALADPVRTAPLRQPPMPRKLHSIR